MISRVHIWAQLDCMYIHIGSHIFYIKKVALVKLTEIKICDSLGGANQKFL